MITIVVNGDEKNIEDQTTISKFLIDIGIEPTKVAVERNRFIVPKSTYEEVALENGDELEIVHFIGGG